MKHIHEKLVNSVPEYRKWHQYLGVSVIHLCLLVVFSTLIASGLIQSILASELDSSLAAAAASQKDKPDHVGKIRTSTTNDRIIVKFKDSTSSSKRADIASKKNLKSKKKIDGIGAEVFTVDPGDTPEEVVQNILKDNKNDIEYVEVDQLAEPSIVPNDPQFSSQWNKTVVGAPVAWDITSGNSSIVVGVADTGVDCNHPDLAANCVAGWEFYKNTSNTADDYGHGTPVAGVIAAVGNNGVNVAGSAWNVKIMPLKVNIGVNAGVEGCDAGCSYPSDIAEATIYAADRGVKVVNNSYKSAGTSQTLRNAAAYLFSKGGILVTSAGNTSGNTGVTFNDPTYLSVGGTTSGDAKYSWSSYGTDVDIAAPGCSTSTARGGGTRSFCGTSNAAPEVSGLLALMYSVNPSASAQYIRDTLFSSTKDLGAAGWDQYFGWGRIQADVAVRNISTGVTPPPTQPPADTTAPSVPQNLQATAMSSTQVNLSWSASTDAVGVTGYSIYRNGTKIKTVSGTTHSDISLSANTTYTYTVSAYDAAGNNSAQSSSVSVTTPVAPFQISSFNVSSKTKDTATISWTTNQPSTGSVSLGTNSKLLNITAASTGTGTTHTATVSALSRNTKYFYQVRAVSSGVTVLSPVSSFKTSSR